MLRVALYLLHNTPNTTVYLSKIMFSVEDYVKSEYIMSRILFFVFVTIQKVVGVNKRAVSREWIAVHFNV